ncbi:hypothetical protein BGP77_05665 [Saccharospirillum sp. MSK14-1]|uniref:motility associated factor glycosyltransferase family protein n=1 Tax=Saccharospirillum sp. MSK14-1 TaxID=1897632 RepID=UPI000D3A8855|nr:6-hydroxymethylpterin diphosphokinase MptE-like protein [Saccharospirillum sp. MSK14-1]PTY36773.1 hypothetical protein BGP77_05665 [Saccharospirillum sp. MSK14-1]
MWPYSQQAIQQRFRKNLSFFQQNMPSLYKVLKDIRFKRLTLSVDEQKKRWDIMDGQRSLYLGDGEGYATEEANTFCGYFPEGAGIQTIAPLQVDNYSAPRFFHNHLNTTLQQLDYSAMDPKCHRMPDFMPLVVFTGIGAGVHIQKTLEQRDCQVVLVMDTDPEALLMSMYLTDWYDIIPRYTTQEGRFFNFILVDEVDEQRTFMGFWNELVQYTPLFPSLNIFYNHLKEAFRDKLIKRIQEEFKVFLTAWGFYDDEANQLNNALHNLKNLVPTLPRNLEADMIIWANSNPAVIVGAGPSLNERIDWIKENRKRFFLISAGTALSILKHHDIVPDMHVEIESDYATVDHLKATLDENYQIPLLAGAIQLNPRVFNLTQRGLLYYKDSTALHAMFGARTSAQLQGMTPTCTNAATGLALQLGFKQLFLFGMDFGYKSKTETHAAGSVYFDEKAPKYLQDSIGERMSNLKVEAIDGSTLLTEPIYNAARDRVEKLLYTFQHQAKAYNCSLGAKIDGTEVVASRDFFEAMIGAEVHPDEYREQLLYRSVLTAPSEIDQGIKLAATYLGNVCQFVRQEVKAMNPDYRGLVMAVLKITRRLEADFRKQRTPLFYLVRGTIWHYLNAGISVCYTATDTDTGLKHLKIWQARFIDFLEQWPQHYEWLVERNVDANDDGWLVKRIGEAVDDPFYHGPASAAKGDQA